jgi:eukaryotic-like serine/threonine-protein kinase
MTLLAGLLIETDRFEEARTLAVNARALYVKALGPNHWRTATATNAEGAALAGLKRSNQAEALLLESHAVLHQDKAVMRYFMNRADRWLAKLYQTTGRPEKAAKYLVQARSID